MFDKQIIHLGLLQACGVDFEVKGYIANAADSADEVIEKKCVCPQPKDAVSPMLYCILKL